MLINFLLISSLISSVLQVPTSNPTASYRPSIAHHLSDNSFSSLPPTGSHVDQSRVPAAMRTNLLFGDVRFDEDIKATKELERRQWLDDLQKQVEENKRGRFTRNDFLNGNVPSIVQEAANRHQQQNGTSPTRNPTVQQTYDKHSDIDDGSKSDKRTQLMDKLKRHGYPTETLTSNSNLYDRIRLIYILDGQSTAQRTGEKLFGPSYESSSKQNMNKSEQSHLNVVPDNQHSYRPFDVHRGEAVNTVDATFRRLEKYLKFTFFISVLLIAIIVFTMNSEFLQIVTRCHMHTMNPNSQHKLPILIIKMQVIEVSLINQAKTILVCVRMMIII